MSHLSQDEINKLWEAQNVFLSKLLTLGAEKYISGLKDIKNAFILKDRSVRCIDEGTTGGIHCAGSGILMDEKEVVEKFKKANIDGIYSHEECGAAGLYAKANNLDASKSDQYGIDFAKHLSSLLNVPYLGHIGIKEMARPSGLHSARCAYYDGTGRLDPSKTEGLANGFVISRRHQSKEYSLKELKVSISIALGSHSFGEKFTKESPFMLIVIGDPTSSPDPTDPTNSNFSVEALKAELKGLEEENNGRVKIDGFTAPIA